MCVRACVISYMCVFDCQYVRMRVVFSSVSVRTFVRVCVV